MCGVRMTDIISTLREAVSKHVTLKHRVQTVKL